MKETHSKKILKEIRENQMNVNFSSIVNALFQVHMYTGHEPLPDTLYHVHTHGS